MDAKSIHSYDILWPISAFLHTLGEGRGEAMLVLLPYDRAAAVRYAHIWAYGRNPRYYDYESIGGDCTNFASQYINANDKAPAWTGVEYLHNFLTRRTPSAGPFAGEVAPERIRPGDIVQLSFDGAGWQHSPVVVAADRPRSYADILVAAHSFDADDRPLSTYEFVRARFLHIGGVYRQG